MSVPYCSNCLERISNCECDGDYPQIFGEHRVDEIKARADERQKILAEVEMWSLDNEESESPDIDCDDPDCECQQQEPVDYDKVIIRNKLLAELRAKVQEMKEGK